MNEQKRQIAVFDFDGTLTTKDTFLEFIKYVFGWKKFCLGFLLHLPIIILMILKLYPNWKAKQRIFGWFFRGMEYAQFKTLGEEFATIISDFANRKTTDILRAHIERGATTYVVSASIEEWVKPYCKQLGVNDVMGTKVEIVEGILTGQFATANCYGKEKVNRFLECEPQRESYILYAYGDSRGDRELLALADHGHYVKG